MCIDRHLYTIAWLADNLEDLDSLVCNLWDLKLEKLFDKFCMGSGKDNAKSVLIFLYFVDIGLDTVVSVINFAWRLIPFWQNSLGLSQVHKDVSVVLTLTVPYYHLAHLVDELGVDLVILDCLAPLVNTLLCALNIHPPECVRIDVDKKLVADLTVFHAVIFLSIININF